MSQIPPYRSTNTPLNPPSSGMAVASMVLGIVALVLFCIWYISIPCAIVGVVLGTLALGKARRGEAAGEGMARAGQICSIIALALAILLSILAIVGVSLLGTHLRQMQMQPNGQPPVQFPFPQQPQMPQQPSGPPGSH